jgi:SAM-dependent methyltransferase
MGKFHDMSRPLVVDIGCGMGVSILGLASMKDAASSEEVSIFQILTQKDGLNLSAFGETCNYLGGDLSQLTVNYARGIAKRWGIEGHVQFSRKPAIEVLHDVESLYPRGRVALIMIQFPTPFKLLKRNESNVDVGNQQLPSNEASGFMVTADLLRLAARLLKDTGGYLLLQSNCEDVAVKMRCIAVEEAGFECMDLKPTVTKLPGLDDPEQLLPLRSREWIQMGGECPVGSGWIAKHVLPSLGHTEIEVNCMVQGTPVHRCLLHMVA